ncbi:MAG: hypothetical protein FIB02_01890 [Desulfuromonas sp.]|nr:hypothetical protein [Desulfuromonas sp.]
MRLHPTRCLGVILLLSVLPAATCLAVEAPLANLPGLDPVSAGCIACHNGSEGSPAGFCLLLPGSRKADGHVISVTYAELAKRNQGIRPIGSLPAEMVLHDGKITCATCHGSDPHNRNSLVIDNKGSALCRACHLK